MKLDAYDVLIEFAKRKGKVTTEALAKRLGSSQQTISRKIRELESSGLISRVSHSRGQFITLTDEGRKSLRRKYLELRDVIERPASEGLSFGGHLISGSGEGRYYVSQDEYFLQFNEKIGFRPFLGTLNIRLKSMNDINSKNSMEKIKPVIRKENRTFGDIKCYPCIINRKIKGSVVIPDRTHHPHDVLEIISPVNLRKELSLKEGDYVHIELRV
jgi:riboflavin kinase